MEQYLWVGNFLFTGCYIFQIYRSYLTNSVKDVSLVMWLVQWAAYTSCLIYAVYFDLKPLMFGYAMGWLMTAWFLEIYRQRRNK